MITVDTDLGTIKVAKNVIGNVIVDVIDSFDGKVMLSNSKGKLPNQLAHKIGPKEDINVMDMELTEEGLELKLYIIIKFGTSIKETTGKLITDIRNSIKETFAMDINELTVVVTGVMSKKIAPRYIEVKG